MIYLYPIVPDHSLLAFIFCAVMDVLIFQSGPDVCAITLASHSMVLFPGNLGDGAGLGFTLKATGDMGVGGSLGGAVSGYSTLRVARPMFVAVLKIFASFCGYYCCVSLTFSNGASWWVFCSAWVSFCDAVVSDYSAIFFAYRCGLEIILRCRDSILFLYKKIETIAHVVLYCWTKLPSIHTI